MGNKTFLDKGLKDELVQDMEKKTKLDDEIEKHIEKALNSVSQATLYSIMDLVIKKGHPQQRRHMMQVKERYENDGVLLEDLLYLLDVYEMKYDELLEGDDDDDE